MITGINIIMILYYDYDNSKMGLFSIKRNDIGTEVKLIQVIHFSDLMSCLPNSWKLQDTYQLLWTSWAGRGSMEGVWKQFTAGIYKWVSLVQLEHLVQSKDLSLVFFILRRIPPCPPPPWTSKSNWSNFWSEIG